MIVPFLGDVRYKNDEDMARWRAATNRNQQIQVENSVTEFEIWDGQEWVDGQEAMNRTYNIQAKESAT